ncbi:hypothetical protein ACIOYT_31755 [Streptomyces halstedii]|uniref:hypothetical protein n=1 Tax=Streptomyces halstedii TaxID=1944 RepID=UPI00381C1F4E
MTNWWAYDGSLGGQAATHLRGSCACGWRGESLYPVDWERVDPRCPYEYDTSGPEVDWQQHVADVESRLVPLPEDLEKLLDQLGSRLSDLSDTDPLVALRAAGLAERTAQLFAGSAALTIQMKKTPLEDVGTALGCSEEEAKGQLREYYSAF